MHFRGGFFRIIAVVWGIFITKADGQCDDATRPLQINATYYPQYVSSPNYPSVYPANSDCAWIITAPSPYDKVIINIEEVSVELSYSACYDYMNVYDGPDDSANELGQFCYFNSDDVNALVSTSDSLYVTFSSDNALHYEGFNIVVFTNSTDYKPDCDGITNLTATSQTQVIMSPNLPDVYESNLTCQILIYPETPIYAVSIDIVFMDIESSANCANDALTISSVANNVTVEAASECSLAVQYEFSNFPLEVSGDYVEINFTTNDAVNYLGFMISYTEVFKGINLTSPENEATIEITVPEDLGIGNVNESVCVIELTHTGTLSVLILPMFELTTSENVSQSDVIKFGFTESLPYIYVSLVSSLDYEVINKFSLIYTLYDSDVIQVTYSVTFNITITDVDDLAPEFINLPGNYTMSRGQNAGDLIYTVNATDGDISAEYSTVLFQIESGDTDSLFEINNATGEITLIQNAGIIPMTTTQYILTIGAYSVSTSKGSLFTTADFTVDISPDSPPECTHDTVWGDTLDANMDGPGKTVESLDRWSCTDDNVNLTYTIESVSPNLTTALFIIDTLGVVTLLRGFNATEVLSRQFLLEIGVTDSVGQQVIFNMYMNVTALTCLPNPRFIYVRMDQAIDGVILDDFNCTNKYGLSFSMRQFPAGTFAVNSENGTAVIVLKAPVVKIKFYSLTVTITDGVDVAVLRFKVVVQTKKCGVASGATVFDKTLVWTILFSLHYFYLFLF